MATANVLMDFIGIPKMRVSLSLHVGLIRFGEVIHAYVKITLSSTNLVNVCRSLSAKTMKCLKMVFVFVLKIMSETFSEDAFCQTVLNFQILSMVNVFVCPGIRKMHQGTALRNVRQINS